MSRPISALDAIFLAVEKPTNPMHIAGLQLFRPAAGTTAAEIATELQTTADEDIAAFFRQRATRSVATAGQWSWEDSDVDLDHHVFSHNLGDGGRVRDLLALCSRLHGEQLDRSRPLWQAHLISGLADGRFAIYFKMHHALGDGVRAQTLLRRSLSRDGSARGAPSPWALTADSRSLNLAPLADRGRFDARALLGEATGLATALRKAKTLRGGSRSLGLGSLTPAAPRSILNVASISGSRRFAAQSWDLQRIQAIRRVAGVSTNDVVLAMCAGALRAYLSDLNALPDDPLVAMVPVALRDTGVLGASSNAVGAVMCNLATGDPDPATRLAKVHQHMIDGKAALATMTPTQTLVLTAIGLAPLLLEPLLGQFSRSRPPFNLIISNVTGSRTPLFFNGARLESVYPLSIPMDGQALNITCTSYLQELSFGVIGCEHNVPHLQRILGHLDHELAALEKAVGLQAGPDASNDNRRPLSRR